MSEVKLVSTLQATAIHKFLDQFQTEFKLRRADDRASHEKICKVCRDKLQPDYAEEEIKFGVKHRATRQFICSIATTQEEAVRKLGWAMDEVSYVMPINIPEMKKKMPEHIKRRLKEINKQRRVERQMERLQKVARGDIDTMAKKSYTSSTSNSKRGGEYMDTLAGWVREFIDGQINEKEDGKDVPDLTKLFELAKVNEVEGAAKYRKELKPENAGRIRMTLGNMLRGAASKNGRLVTLGGGTKVVPEGLIPKKKEKAPKAPKAAKKAKGEKKAKAA